MDARPVPSTYLLSSDDDADTLHVKRLLAALHMQQHPPKEECRNRRLIVTQYSPKSFEGIGSILKLLVHGLAEAAHANRTLIWGLDLPYVFENTRELWHEDPPELAPSPSGAKGRARKSQPQGPKLYGPQPPRTIVVNGLELECSGWRGRGGGAHACFFEPLSSCSLDDVTPEEVHAMGAGNGHADDARVRIQEARRGPSAYHPPYGNPVFAEVFGARPRMGHPRHTWAAALGAYAFRLKPELAGALERHRLDVWEGAGLQRGTRGDGGALGDEELLDAGVDALGSDMTLPLSSPSYESRPIVWGMHVRHGDVTALADIYGNRRVYDFGEYFAAAHARAKQVVAVQFKKRGGSVGGLNSAWKLPSGVFVASDDPETSEHVDSYSRPSALAAWPGGAPRAPVIFTVNASERYRTPHGSHTVAADGGCVRDVCAMHAHDILAYRAQPDHAAVPRPQRIMRVLLESIADLYMLSHTDHLVSQGSSHFSTLAAMLIWARTGGVAAPSRCTYLDEGLIAEGIVQTSYLHGSLNGTAHIAPGRGHERWASHSRRFFEGLTVPERSQSTDGALRASSTFSIDGPEMRLALVDGLPLFPGDTFYREARRWLGGHEGEGREAPIWAGECPLQRLPRQRAHDYIIELINHGADHSDLHPSQAAKCWSEAGRVLQDATQDGIGDPVEPDQAANLQDVIVGNLAAQRAGNSFPYSMPKESVATFLRINVGPQHPAVGNRAFLKMT